MRSLAPEPARPPADRCRRVTANRGPFSPEVCLLPTGRATATYVERGSRFLAVIELCRFPEHALAVRDVERRRHHDATHHVWAVRLADGSFRTDDDSEPTGTGGRPILAEIDGAGLVDSVCVVTRYFGGTKLGTSGLARAYGLAAARAIECVSTRRVRRAETRHVTYGFEDTGSVARVLASQGAVRDGDEFSETVRTAIRIAAGTADRLEQALRDATQGRASLEPSEAPPASWIAAET